MARVQLVISDEERDQFIRQARREGMTLSAWLRAAARERLEKRKWTKPFESVEDVEAFFSWCDTLEGQEPEPDWSEHLKTINESKSRGLPPV